MGLAGLAVIAFGLWLRFGGPMAEFATDKKSPELFFMGLYVLVGAGAIMSAVGFFGCCGAARESQCLIGTFFACLLVIFAGEVTAGVFAFIGKKVAIQEAQKIYEDAYEDYMKNPVGKMNSTIYRYHVAVSTPPPAHLTPVSHCPLESRIPPSELQCCGKGNVEQQTGLPCPENIQLPKNCLVEIQNVIDTHLHLVGIVGIAIASITVEHAVCASSVPVQGVHIPQGHSASHTQPLFAKNQQRDKCHCKKTRPFIQMQKVLGEKTCPRRFRLKEEGERARLRDTKKPNCEFKGPLKSTLSSPFVPKASLWLRSGAGVEPRSRKAAPLSDLWRIELACGSQTKSESGQKKTHSTLISSVSASVTITASTGLLPQPLALSWGQKAGKKDGTFLQK
ncbi:hypothetical protein IHE44_0008360 [Lamprotornis superbus]|uniref:Tetraspanin n=1 Tax=Lamprotornis superbus TaxID=245042 RepID=A0A835TSJ9_9PASS|nr:hypothetical protein IHE44_0008360 [Lamprotornis superbus]